MSSSWMYYRTGYWTQKWHLFSLMKMLSRHRHQKKFSSFWLYNGGLWGKCFFTKVKMSSDVVSNFYGIIHGLHVLQHYVSTVAQNTGSRSKLFQYSTCLISGKWLNVFIYCPPLHTITLDWQALIFYLQFSIKLHGIHGLKRADETPLCLI